MLLPFLNLAAGKVDGRTLTGGEMTSHISQEIYENLPEMKAQSPDIKLLFFATSSGRSLMTNKPIRKVADLKGLKINDVGGAVTDMWKALGAAPLAMASQMSMKLQAKASWMVLMEAGVLCFHLNYMKYLNIDPAYSTMLQFGLS